MIVPGCLAILWSLQSKFHILRFKARSGLDVEPFYGTCCQNSTFYGLKHDRARMLSHSMELAVQIPQFTVDSKITAVCQAILWGGKYVREAILIHLEEDFKNHIVVLISNFLVFFISISAECHNFITLLYFNVSSEMANGWKPMMFWRSCLAGRKMWHSNDQSLSMSGLRQFMHSSHIRLTGTTRSMGQRI